MFGSLTAVSAAVVSANEAFYRAFRTRDLSAMDAAWAVENPIACIHPGWAALFGREEVMASWESILGNPDAPAIRCAEPHVEVYGDTAFVVCFELIDGNPARLVATNIFVRESDAWRLVHHQAGPCEARAWADADDEPGEPVH